MSQHVILWFPDISKIKKMLTTKDQQYNLILAGYHIRFTGYRETGFPAVRN